MLWVVRFQSNQNGYYDFTEWDGTVSPLYKLSVLVVQYL